jgi:hypothetical protein
VAHHIQIFYRDLKAGMRPKLILQAPPQHGKSEQIRDDACCAATAPEHRHKVRANAKWRSMELHLMSNSNDAASRSHPCHH